MCIKRGVASIQCLLSRGNIYWGSPCLSSFPPSHYFACKSLGTRLHVHFMFTSAGDNLAMICAAIYKYILCMCTWTCTCTMGATYILVVQLVVHIPYLEISVDDGLSAVV